MVTPDSRNFHFDSSFRLDINALRAFAVLSVIFFHFDFEVARGGYLGVDAFFVISGYLMTSIVLSKLEKNKFSLSGFYISRAFRIIPALAWMCILLLAVGWFLIFPFDYSYLSRLINHALVFKSNISFANGSGYFDVGNDVEWLLHTWSLSVEMQFYLLYPLILILVHKMTGLRGVRFILSALMLLSLGAYVIEVVTGDVNKAFYLLPFRAWELLAGALVVVFPLSETNSDNKKGVSYILPYIGMLALAVSVAFGDGQGTHSIFWAILTTLGTVCILCKRDRWPNRVPLILRPFERVVFYIGLTSYSLYLWHWPIRSFQQYLGYENNAWVTGLGIAATFACGIISYYLVETKIRAKAFQGWRVSKRSIITVFSCIVPIVCAYGGAKMVREGSGFVQRLNTLPFDGIPTYLFENPELYLLEGIADKCQNNGTACRLSDGKLVREKTDWKPDVILTGDSHAVAIAHALSETPLHGNPLKVLMSGSSACIYVSDFDQTKVGDRKFERCKRAYKNLMNILDETPSDIPLLMVNYFPKYLVSNRWKEIQYTADKDASDQAVPIQDAWKKLVCKISENRKVYLMRTVPTSAQPVIKTLIQAVLRNEFTSLNQRSFSVSLEEHRGKTKMEASLLESAVMQCGAEMIDPASAYCKNKVCYGVSKDLVPYYRDSSHLNLFGSRRLIPLFSKIFSAQ